MLQTVGTLITALGALLAALALRASQRQRLRQFEAVYVQRYWQLMDRLSLSALKGRLGSEHDGDNEQVVLAYLRLCEDQCEMRSAGWIGDATWRIWSEGMIELLGDPADDTSGREPFAAVWRQEVLADETQFTLLRRLLAGTFDPYEPNLRKRLLNGLYGRSGV